MASTNDKLKLIARKGKTQLDILVALQNEGLRGIISGPVGANIPRIATLAGLLPRTDLTGDGMVAKKLSDLGDEKLAESLRDEALQGLFDATDCYLGLDRTGRVWEAPDRFAKYTVKYTSEQPLDIEKLMRKVGVGLGLSVRALVKPYLRRSGEGLNEATYEFYKELSGKDTLMLRLTVGECLDLRWQSRLANGDNNVYYGIGKSLELGDNTGEVIFVPWGTTANWVTGAYINGRAVEKCPCYLAVLGYGGLAMEPMEFIHCDTAATVLAQLVMQTYGSAVNPAGLKGGRMVSNMLYFAAQYLLARGTIATAADIEKGAYLGTWGAQASIDADRTEDIMAAMGQANGFAVKQFKSNENLRLWKFCLLFWNNCLAATTTLGKNAQLSMAIKAETLELFVAEYSKQSGYLPLKSFKCAG